MYVVIINRNICPSSYKVIIRPDYPNITFVIIHDPDSKICSFVLTDMIVVYISIEFFSQLDIYIMNMHNIHNI